MKLTSIILILLLIGCTAIAQDNAVWGFGGIRYDNGAYLVSLGALSEDIELLPIPGVLAVDVGPLSSIWYTDIFSTAWDNQPEKTSSISFELAVKTSLLTPRLTGGLTLGTSFDQQDHDGSIGDYFAAATGGFAAFNLAKHGAKDWGPWAYLKYKSGLTSGYIDRFQAGAGFFVRI